MDDYYELLDVAPDSDRDDIRVAYRAKRDELQAQEGDGTRAKVAELNRAWNVLSDPAQRERYDERLAEHREAGDVDEDDEEYDDDDSDSASSSSRASSRSRSSSNSSSKPKSKAEERAAARAAARRRPPTIVLPAGLKIASGKARGLALLFDLMVLLLVFSLAQVIGVKIIDNKYPGQRKAYDALVKKVNAADKVVSADGTKESDANKQASDAATRHDAAGEAKAKATAATAHAAKLKDTKTRDTYKAQAKVISNRLTPASFLLFAATMVLALLYLVPLTALTGQTLGKRLRKIRVVRLDGSRPGWSAALVRFGVPIMIATILWTYLQQLALAVVLLGMIGWINNPNKQGLHDRLAKTVVVEA
jgi:curved DNA-binding protein CbpA